YSRVGSDRFLPRSDPSGLREVPGMPTGRVPRWIGVFTLRMRGPPSPTLFPYTTLFRSHRTATSPYVGAALQMLAGGGAVALLGTALGEWSRWHLTAKGAGAVAYLVVFGSILGYSAYTYALRHASPTIVGTYAYVNPV